MLSALDVGSAFEGMGTAREASFTAFIEPALFLLMGSAALATGPDLRALLVAGAHRATSLGVTSHGHSLRPRARDQRAPAAVSSSAMPAAASSSRMESAVS